ncbi:ATP-binding protein [Cellulosimicrobium terreum]|nr:ATP-binding protein [Cellulosimicrobium terreum]
MRPADRTSCEYPATVDVPAAGSGVPTTRPSGHFGVVHEWSIESLDGLTTLRHELGEILGAEGGSDVGLGQTPEKLVLVASELATNALEHGRPPTEVQLRDDSTTWLLDVADHDHRTAPEYAGERVPGEGGLGLHLARVLSLEVGWYTTGQTKNVWVTFPKA